MLKKMRILVTGLLFAVLLLSATGVSADFASGYVNPDTGYKLLIDDYADLLTDDQEKLLVQDMLPITEFGNVAFVSTDENSFSTSLKYAGDYCYRHFGNQSSTVFLIDMDKRQVTIATDGPMYKIINTGIANTIVDNVYFYASQKLYYRCAQEVFTQITSVLSGQKIAQPMKHAGNVLIALLAAMLINFIIVSRKARLRAAKNAEFLSASKQNYLRFANPRGKLVNTTRKYSPQSRGGGFIGGGGSGGGGGGGGGGFSGGGGSHGF